MVCLELYADKTKLSSFGTQKGYPVMARILNLPVGIRNGDGFGGARVVGWLPVVCSKYFLFIQNQRYIIGRGRCEEQRPNQLGRLQTSGLARLFLQTTRINRKDLRDRALGRVWRWGRMPYLSININPRRRLRRAVSKD